MESEYRAFLAREVYKHETFVADTSNDVVNVVCCWGPPGIVEDFTGWIGLHRSGVAGAIGQLMVPFLVSGRRRLGLRTRCSSPWAPNAIRFPPS